MSEDSENDTISSSETEDEDIPDDILDKDFFKTLSHLKNKDPVIYDENVHFFSEKESQNEPSINKKNEHLYLRDYEREMLLGGISEDNDKTNEKGLTYVEEQKQLKTAFKSLIDNDSDDEGLLQKKEKTEKEKIKEEEEYVVWLKGRKDDIANKSEEGVLKPLRDYWNNPELDKGEEFLKDYILNQRWREKEDVVEDCDLSEDGDLLEAQENFEREYNFKDDNGANIELKRFPRKVEGSLRKKDDSRKRKRAEITQRKKEEKKKKKLDIQKAQKEKLNDIKSRLEQLKAMTGNETLGVDDSEVIGDFDPDKHDNMMNQLYGDEFYSKEDLEKPEFNMDDMDCDIDEYENVTRSKKKKDRKRKNKKAKVKDITDVIKPEDENFQEMANEFYSLDCEDFIDDIPCRFKYREVVPNDYGLTVEEILAADEAELNKWVPVSKLYKIRPAHVEKNEIKTYRKKASDLKLKSKLLPSLFKTEEEIEIEKPESHDRSNLINEDDKLETNENNLVKKKKEQKTSLNTESQGVSNQLNLSSPTDKSDFIENESKDGHQIDKTHSKMNNDKVNRKKKTGLNIESQSPSSQSKNISPMETSDCTENDHKDNPTDRNNSEMTNSIKSSKKKRKRKKKMMEDNQNGPHRSGTEIHKKDSIFVKKNGTKFQNKKTKKDPASNISDNRLLAYDIKPKRFRSKFQFST
ncbi:protein KRI1 homolog [Cimex lectularius]|uniref:Protein KRI1 homolog n=1 Tax=Cimex lectularius TaxID=79782 RepID=A0A8I6RHP4_CIMLE|nr:protein KRI1 homolog [Cimex lectularius]